MKLLLALSVGFGVLFVPLTVDAAEDKTKEWPGHNKAFAGPGDPHELAAAALEFLRQKPDWTRPEYDDVHRPYAACVTGSAWAVSKKAPLTHQTTQYSLDILVAFTGDADPEAAYVYHMVFYTTEEAGVDKGLPFRYANSRQYAKFKIPLDKVPAPGGGAGGGFGLWRILTGILLLAGGLVGTGRAVGGRIPGFKGFVTGISRLSLPIGVALAVVGLGGLLCNLGRLAPLASILPELVAIALGIVLLRKSRIFRGPETPPAPPEPSETPEPEEATDAPAPADPPQAIVTPPKTSIVVGIMNKLAFLDGLESPLGFAALILGLLHLILGGLPLI